MALDETPAQIEKPIFWAEVAGPVAAVRQWCAADAPFVTRIGHGGVAQIIDYLSDKTTSWYEIAAGKRASCWAGHRQFIGDESRPKIHLYRLSVWKSISSSKH